MIRVEREANNEIAIRTDMHQLDISQFQEAVLTKFWRLPDRNKKRRDIRNRVICIFSIDVIETIKLY
jgi:hypothetical protein